MCRLSIRVKIWKVARHCWQRTLANLEELDYHPWFTDRDSILIAWLCTDPLLHVFPPPPTRQLVTFSVTLTAKTAALSATVPLLRLQHIWWNPETWSTVWPCLLACVIMSDGFSLVWSQDRYQISTDWFAYLIDVRFSLRRALVTVFTASHRSLISTDGDLYQRVLM